MTQFFQVAAWTSQTGTTRYPVTGTFDLGGLAYLGGVIGLNPEGAFSRGVVTIFWTSDAEGERICGVQGMNLTSSIISLAELRLLNRGPYCYLTYQAFVGSNPLAATLFATPIGGRQPLLCGDTILITERDRPLGPNALETIYPCDYFAGDVRVFFSAPIGVLATVHGADLTDVFYPLDVTGPGAITTIVPMGTWCVVMSNATAFPVTYSLSVTPLVT